MSILVSWRKGIVDFWKRNSRMLVVGTSFVLTVVFSFELGYFQALSRSEAPLLIEKPVTEVHVTADSAVSETENRVNSEKIVEVQKEKTGVNAGCVFVGSKNSNKYHLPSCQWAKRIKPENRVCFSTKEEAEKRGYVAGCVQ